MINLIWPVPGFFRVSSPFGTRPNPFGGAPQMHNGIDIARTLSPPQPIDGANIAAVADGRVIHAHFSQSAGLMIVIDHGSGVETGYMHNSVNLVKAGQQVRQGEVIARVGNTGQSTGAHLHFYVKIGGKFVDPMEHLSKGDEEMRYQTVQEMPEWARPEIQRLIAQKILTGSDGKLDLSMDMIRMLVMTARMLKNERV